MMSHRYLLSLLNDRKLSKVGRSMVQLTTLQYSSLRQNNTTILMNNLRKSDTTINTPKRPFFSWISSTPSYKHLKSHIAIMESIKKTDDIQQKMKLIKTLSLLHPTVACKTIEILLSEGSLPLNEDVLKEYIYAASLNRKSIDSLNINAIISLIQKNQLNGNYINHDGAKLSTGMLSGILTKGSSSGDPIYMKTVAPSFREKLGGEILKLLSFMFMIAFVYSLIDSGKSTNPNSKSVGGISSFLSSSVVHQAEKSNKSFNDVVGIDEAKADLEEIVQYLKNPQKFTRLGGKLPKGVLLTGPPGTGKTLLARAIAGEANVPFFFASGSEFDEMFVGVGAKRIRDLFDAAKSKGQAIIFIDEIDAIGGSRHLKDQSAMKMTLNQLLVEMDGFEENTGVVVIAATNFPQDLDKALVRPGRFDKHVDVPLPDIGGRKAILELYLKKLLLSKDVNVEILARGTPGFSGAELFNLVNQAALKASIDGLNNVTMQAFEYAKDKILMGAEKRSAIISPETMKTTAFHEAGHALVAMKTDGSNPIHKATIMPRGRALGMVMQLPDGDQTSYSRKQMFAHLDVCMGGRVAEEIVFGPENVTSGASNDILQATRLATTMVTKYGLSEKVGIIHFDEKIRASNETQKFIDEEVKLILTESYNRAKKIIEANRKELDIIAKGLQEYESLSGNELVELLKGNKPDTSKIGNRNQQPSRDLKPIAQVNKDQINVNKN